MAMNMMGLGFAFGAKDKGLGKMVDKTTKGVGAIAGLVTNVGKQAGRFSLGAMFNIPTQAIGTMQSIAADTRVTTTMLEAFGVQASKSSRMATVGLNLTSVESKKARKEIASTAFSMNVDVGSVATSWKALQQNQVEATEVGFKSFKQYQKFLSMTGTDASEFASAMGFMSKTMGMTNEETEDLIQTTLVLGKKFDMGAEAVPAMIKNMRSMRETGAALFKEWGKERTAKFLHSTTMVSGAFMKAGHSAAEAESLSQGLLGSLMKGEKQFHSLYTGLETDLGDFGQMLSENFLGPQEAFELLQKSPTEFIAKMHKAVGEVDKIAEAQVKAQYGISDASELSGKQLEKYNADVLANQSQATKRFSQQMTQALGPETTDLIMSGFGATSKTIEKLEGNLDKLAGKKGAIGKVTKEFRDGRTAAERFAIAQDRMVTRMKKLKGTMSDTTFLKDYRQSSNSVLGEMQTMAAKGGPVGKAMTTLIDFSNFGIGGVLARLHPMGLGLTTVIQKFAPFLQMLPAIAIGLKAVFSPMTMLVAAIGGIYLALKYPKEAAKAFKKFTETIKKHLPKVIGIAKEMVVGIAKAVAGVFTFIWDHIDWGLVKTKLVWVAGKIGEGLKWALLKVLDFASMLIQAFGNINFDTIRKYLTIGFKYAFYAMVLAVGWVLKQLPHLIKGAFKIIYAVIFSFFDGIRDAFKEQFPLLSGFFDVFFAAIKYGFTVVVSYMAAKWLYLQGVAMVTATKAFLHRQKLLIKSKIAWGKYFAGRMADYAVDTAKAVWSFGVKVAKLVWWATISLAKVALVAVATYGFYLAMGAASVAAFAIAVGGIVAWAAVQAATLIAATAKWLFFWAASFAPITAILLAIAAVGVAIYAIVEYWDDIVGFFKGLGKSIGGIFKKIGQSILDFITWPIDLAIQAYEGMKNAIGGVLDSVGGFFSDIGSGISDTFSSVSDFVTGSTESSTKGVEDQMAAIKTAGANAKGWFSEMTDKIKGDTSAAVNNQAAEGARLGVNLSSVIDKVKDFSGKAATTAVNFLKEAADKANSHWTSIYGSAVLEGNLADVEKTLKAHEAMKENVHYSETEDFGKNLDAQMKMEADYLKNKGRNLEEDNRITKQKILQFGVNEEAIASLSSSDQAYFAKSRAGLVQQFALQEQQLSNMNSLGDMNDEQHFKALVSARSAAKEQRALQNIQFVLARDGIKGLAAVSDETYRGMEKSVAHRTAMMQLSFGRYAQSAAASLAGLTGDVLAKTQEATDLLTAARRAEVAAFAATKKAKEMSLADFETQVASIDKKYLDAQTEIANKARAGQEKMLSGMVGKDAVLKEVDDLAAKYKKKVGDMADASTSEITSAAAQAFGVTGREAMSFLKDMAGIDKKKLVADLAVIQKKYIGFLEAVQNQGANLLKETRKQFKEYLGEFENFWKGMETFANDYGQRTLNISRNFWNAMVRFAENGASNMTVAATAMIATLEANFRNVNLLDILTSGGKIYDWALRIVRSLQQAFAGTNPFDTAIALAARNAEAIIDSMARNKESKGTITPVTRMSHGQVSSESARMKVKDDLIAATHAPAWSKKVIEQNDIANRVLENGFRALLMSQAGSGKRGSRAKEEYAQIDLQAPPGE
jgi:hypothetical protein